MRHFAQFVLVGCTHLWWNAKCVVVFHDCVTGGVYAVLSCSHASHCSLGFACRKVDHQMAELFELEEEVIRISSDVMDKYERDMTDTVTGKNHLPVRVALVPLS